MKPLVSILIPCYNAEPWIAATLESAIAQTWSNTEIIVVDDGSTDQSLAIASSFQSSRVKLLSQSNQGAAAARNLAFQQAQGELIQYLDADDLLSYDKIEQQIVALESDEGSIVSAAWGRFTQQPEQAYFKPDRLWQDLSPIKWLVIAFEDHSMMNPACWLVPRAIAQAAGSWNESLTLNDDGEYFGRVILASQQVKFCRDAKVYYRSVAGSLSSLKSESAWRSLYDSLENACLALLNFEDSERTRHALATAFQRFIYETYPDVPQLRQKAEERVKLLGGTDLPPLGGSNFLRLSRIIGWKPAKQLQRWANSLPI